MKLTFLVVFGLLTAGKPAVTRNATPKPPDESLVIQHADMPSYPAMARVAHVTGTVQIEITIRNGVVVQSEQRSSVHPILINAALENVRTWKFRPDANAKFSVTYIYLLKKKRSASGNPRIEMELPYLVKITAQPPQTTTNY
ncbi:MAG TPA: TonB family protein [Candidatus Angelobacter sp.]|nr:TonB family protein [Candidatus Angelobacter sp.]